MGPGDRIPQGQGASARNRVGLFHSPARNQVVLLSLTLHETVSELLGYRTKTSRNSFDRMHEIKSEFARITARNCIGILLQRLQGTDRRGKAFLHEIESDFLKRHDIVSVISRTPSARRHIGISTVLFLSRLLHRMTVGVSVARKQVGIFVLSV